MPVTDCSHCEKQIEAVPLNETDTGFDWRCPSCRQPVLLDGSSKEQQRQIQAREQISEHIQDLAAEIDTADYAPPRYSVEELGERLEAILEEIDDELDRR